GRNARRGAALRRRGVAARGPPERYGVDRRRSAPDWRVDRLAARAHRAHDVSREAIRTRPRRGVADAAEPRRASEGRRDSRLALPLQLRSGRRRGLLPRRAAVLPQRLNAPSTSIQSRCVILAETIESSVLNLTTYRSCTGALASPRWYACK